MKKPTGEVLRVLKELKEQIDLIQKEGNARGNMVPMLDQLQGFVNVYLNGEKSPPHYTVVRDVLNRVTINYMSDEEFDDNDKKVLQDFMTVKKVEAVSAQRASLTSAQNPPLPPRRSKITEPARQQEEAVDTTVTKQDHKQDIIKAFDELKNNGSDWMRREGSKAELATINGFGRLKNGGSDIQAVQSFVNCLKPKSLPGFGVKFISSHQKDIATKFMNTEGMKKALRDPLFQDDLRALMQSFPQEVRALILKELPSPMTREEVLDIKEPQRKSASMLSPQDAMRYFQEHAIRLVGVKGDANTLLATAIYLIREDLSKKENSPEVISARDAMQNLDKQFRESANSNPLNKEKNNQKLRDCIAEINDRGILEKCYAKEAKVVYSSKK